MTSYLEDLDELLYDAASFASLKSTRANEYKRAVCFNSYLPNDKKIKVLKSGKKQYLIDVARERLETSLKYLEKMTERIEDNEEEEDNKQVEQVEDNKQVEQVEQVEEEDNKQVEQVEDNKQEKQHHNSVSYDTPSNKNHLLEIEKYGSEYQYKKAGNLLMIESFEKLKENHNFKAVLNDIKDIRIKRQQKDDENFKEEHLYQIIRMGGNYQIRQSRAYNYNMYFERVKQNHNFKPVLNDIFELFNSRPIKKKEITRESFKLTKLCKGCILEIRKIEYYKNTVLCKKCHNKTRNKYKRTDNYIKKGTGYNSLPQEIKEGIMNDIKTMTKKETAIKYGIKYKTFLMWNADIVKNTVKEIE